jgi:hypothetical protein
MNTASCLRLSTIVAICALLLLSGCSSNVRVQGKVLNNGSPVVVDSGDTLNVGLRGTNSKGGAVVVPAKANNDGTFVAESVPPGKYQLVIGIASGANDPAGLARNAELNKPFEVSRGRLECEISGPQNLTIDVGTGVITKQ